MEDAEMSRRTMRILSVMLVVGALCVTGLPNAEAEEPSLDEMVRQIHDGGFVILAVQAEKTVKVRDAAHLKNLLQNDEPTTFFLEEMETGKRHKVGETGGKKEGWGPKIWRFYCCLAGEPCCNK
jgi:hypothetical protein